MLIIIEVDGHRYYYPQLPDEIARALIEVLEDDDITYESNARPRDDAARLE